MNTPLILFFIIIIIFNNLSLRCKWKCKYVPCYILLVKFSLGTFKLVDIINEDNWKEICILILSLCEWCLRVAVACFLSHIPNRGIVSQIQPWSLFALLKLALKILCLWAQFAIFPSIHYISESWISKFFLWSENYVLQSRFYWSALPPCLRTAYALTDSRGQSLS